MPPPFTGLTNYDNSSGPALGPLGVRTDTCAPLHSPDSFPLPCCRIRGKKWIRRPLRNMARRVVGHLYYYMNFTCVIKALMYDMLQYVIKNMYCCRMFLTGSRSAQFDTEKHFFCPFSPRTEKRIPPCVLSYKREEWISRILRLLIFESTLPSSKELGVWIFWILSSRLFLLYCIFFWIWSVLVSSSCGSIYITAVI